VTPNSPGVRSASPFKLTLPMMVSMDREPVRVVAARFEDLVERGLRSLLEEEPSVQLVRAGVPHHALAAALAEHEPDIAFINFGSLVGAAELRELHSARPQTRLIVLGNRLSAAEANQLLALGACACLSKDTEARDVLSAIHLASRGLQVLPRIGTAAAQADARATRAGGAADGRPAQTARAPELLTPREAEVVGLLRDGRSNAEIGQILGVSVETVRTHARHIYRKLGVRSRRDLRRVVPR
jgi:DNA-binding NarL/FixJ family response regulator